MVTGYEAGFYRDMTQMKQDLDTNLSGLTQDMEQVIEMLHSIERTMLIAALVSTATPKDMNPAIRLRVAAQEVDKFLKEEGV